MTYSYSKNSSSGGNFQFTDPDYNTLMATLTARMGREEIGRCFPNLTLVLNGITVPQDGSTVNVPDDSAPVKTGTFSVVDNITLPTWTNVSSPAVQDAQRAEWNRYATAVAAHEDLHAADDKGTYDPVGTTLGQKKIGAAIDAVSAATAAANAKAGPGTRPTLPPRSTRSVPPRSPDRSDSDARTSVEAGDGWRTIAYWSMPVSAVGLMRACGRTATRVRLPED